MLINSYKSNLRGYSFKDEDLKNTDFSKADIRGADFTNADLTGAIFKEAKISGTNFYNANLTGAILDNAVCGVKIWWSIIIFIISLFIISLSGFSASIIINCNFYFFLGIRGINKIIFTILISVGYISFFHAYFLNKLFNIQQTYLIYIGICIILIVGVFIPFIETMDEHKTENMQIFISIIFFSIIVVLVNIILIYTNLDHITSPITRRAIGAFFGSLLGIVISEQAIINKEKKYVWIWNLFVYIASVQGTKFHYSNLKDASFANVNLKGSNFSECTLTRTNWSEVKKIDCARIQGNYLENSIIRDLVIKKRTRKERDYQGMDLRELNLVGAKLHGVKLSRADLSNSQLIEAKLEDSILNQTKLDNVDLRRANITGATIEMRSIPATAQLDGLICDYFYPQQNPTHRYPTTGTLTSEEAITLLQKPSQVSIIFEQDGIDWQVFLQVFENCLNEFHISPNNSDNLIQAFESRLNGNFVIRLNVPNNVNKVEFEQRLKQAYNNGIEDLKRQYQNTLRTTNIDFQENTSMFKITKQLANPGNLIIQNIVTTGNNSMTNNPGGISQNVSGGNVYGGMQAVQNDNNQQTQETNINAGTMTNNLGGFSIGDSVSGDINNVQGDNNQQRVSNKTSSFDLKGAQFGGGLVNAETVNANQIGGNITNYNPEQKQNLAQAATEIQELLNQLSQTYPTTTTSQKMSVVAKAVDEIEKNPTLKARVIGALKSGGTEALKELVDHPLVNILVASIEGWQEAE